MPRVSDVATKNVQMKFSSPAGVTARTMIAALNLQPLPGEGGFFRQTWRSEASSAILFLLTPTEFSALHQLDREEIWHFYGGEPVELVRLDPISGSALTSRMGPDVLNGEEPQVIVPKGFWQGARVISRLSPAADFALMGCTVSPPWDELAFTLGRRDELSRTFPRHVDLIRALTR